MNGPHGQSLRFLNIFRRFFVPKKDAAVAFINNNRPDRPINVFFSFVMDDSHTHVTHSAQETEGVGEKLAALARPGDILLLIGPLGAGKTTFVKGIARGLGVTDDIVSPTFTLMNAYRITNNELRIKNLIHIDTYRLNSEQELLDIGVADYLGAPETVCVIEWPEKAEHLLKRYHTTSIQFNHEANGGRRIAILSQDAIADTDNTPRAL